MSQQDEHMQLVAAMMQDKTPVMLTTSPLYLMVIHGALEAGIKLPSIGAKYRELLKRLSTQFETVIAKRHPIITSAQKPDDLMPIANDDKLMSIELTYASLYHILATMQLAARLTLPSDGIDTSPFESLGHKIQAMVLKRHPRAADLLNMGWDRRYDA